VWIKIALTDLVEVLVQRLDITVVLEAIRPIEVVPPEARVIEAVQRLQEVEVLPLELLPIEVQGQEQEVQELLEVQVLERISLTEVRHPEVVATEARAVALEVQEATEVRAVALEAQEATEVRVAQAGHQQAAGLPAHVVPVEEEIKTWPKIIQERFKI